MKAVAVIMVSLALGGCACGDYGLVGGRSHRPDAYHTPTSGMTSSGQMYYYDGAGTMTLQGRPGESNEYIYNYGR